MLIRFVILAVLGLVLASCSPSGSSTESTDVVGSIASTTTMSASAGQDSGERTTTTADAGKTTTTSDRDLAPDFTLALGDGGSYTLSESARPVYLVFWAEW